MNITIGRIKTAQKIVLYGCEGIGKSTFASKFPDPLFIDTEGSTKKLDVRRFDKPTSWEMLKAEVKYVINNPYVCKTLVIDTIDWAEQLCIEQVCSAAGKKGIEDFGYGNGYVYEKEEFARFLMLLDDVISKGVNVLLTAHAQLRKFEQPDEMGAYDRWELKLGKKTSSQISPLIKEWADMVLFANYKTFAVSTDDKGKKFKAQGGKRVMFTTHHPCWDAKNRDGLADELPFDYSEIAHLLDDAATQPVKTVEHADFTEIIDDEPQTQFIPEPRENKSEKSDNPDKPISSNIPKALVDLMENDKITEKELQKTVFDRGHFPLDTPIENYGDDFINGWIIPHWDAIMNYVKNNLR